MDGDMFDRAAAGNGTMWLETTTMWLDTTISPCQTVHNAL
jgi:hypothetical protein